VAARLGDPDAQTDLAFCLANGKGCKKDRKEAAKWYRAAVSYWCLVYFAISDCIAGGPRTERHWACMDLQGEISVKQFFNIMIVTINSLSFTYMHSTFKSRQTLSAKPQSPLSSLLPGSSDE